MSQGWAASSSASLTATKSRNARTSGVNCLRLGATRNRGTHSVVQSVHSARRRPRARSSATSKYDL